MFWTHIWQDTSSAHPYSQRDSGDEASRGASPSGGGDHDYSGQVGWLRQRVSDGRDSFCSDIAFVLALLSTKKYMSLLLVSEINHCDS
jgi:hypothetical protein